MFTRLIERGVIETILTLLLGFFFGQVARSGSLAP